MSTRTNWCNDCLPSRENNRKNLLTFGLRKTLTWLVIILITIYVWKVIEFIHYEPKKKSKVSNTDF